MPAGRPAGATNKSRRALENRLLERFPEWNPIIHMAEIANNPDADLPIQLNAASQVAQYLYPKLKAIEVETINQEPLQVQIVRYGDTDTLKPSGS